MNEIITSTRNDKVKLLRSLATKKGRTSSGLYLVEGYNIIKDMPTSVDVQGLFVKESMQEKYASLVTKWSNKIIILADFVFDSVSETVTSNGILATVSLPKSSKLKGGFVVVADSINDAGNMGTIIRTAVAMGATDIVTIDSVDVCNPKVVRSTMGGIFNINIISATHTEALELLQSHTIVVLDMAGENIFEYTVSGDIAVVVGNEAKGVSEQIKKESQTVLSIPMYGAMESLNAGVSMGVALAVIANKKYK
ncbi:MAG: RNA methyltransferase [Bacillota bacterium]